MSLDVAIVHVHVHVHACVQQSTLSPDVLHVTLCVCVCTAVNPVGWTEPFLSQLHHDYIMLRLLIPFTDPVGSMYKVTFAVMHSSTVQLLRLKIIIE